jgi:predicted Zn-dependent protease
MMRQIGTSALIAMVNGGKAPPMIENLVKDFIDVRYTQVQEAAADSFGLDLLARSGIDPICFADFLEKVDSDTSSNSDYRQVAEFFSTHPGGPDRIAKAREASKHFDRATRKPIQLDWLAVKKNLPSIFD